MTSRLKVALVAHDINDRGGMERACSELIRRGNASVDFAVISATLSEDFRRLVRWYRVPVIQRPAPLKFVLFYVIAMVQLWRTGAHRVHTVGAIVPNRADLVWVQHCHAGVRDRTRHLAPPTMPLARRLNSALFRLIALAAERWSYRRGRAGVLIVASAEVEQEVRRHFPGVPLAMVPNGVDGSRFAFNPQHRARLRQSYGVDTALVILFVGGDWYRKGLDLAIHALSRAQASSREPLQLWVAGRGDPSAFRGLAMSLGIGDQVRFVGCPSEVEPFYSAADIFVLPSAYEGFSLVVLEAAAARLPVISTRVGIANVLLGQDAGILVDRTPEAIAQALSRLANDAGLRKRMGEEVQQRTQLFGWDHSVRKLLDLYADVRISGKRSPVRASGGAPS